MKPIRLLSRIFAAFGLIMLFAVYGWGETPDAADACSDGATVISYNSSITITGESPNNDADYYKVTVPADKTLAITTSSPNNHDYHLSIGSTCAGTQYYSDTTAQNHSVPNIVLMSGSTVYFYVKETGNDTDQYQLNLTFTDYVPDPNAANFHEGSRPFTIRNPANTRNIFGNYFVGGNTNMCVTDATNNFNGACTNIATYKNNSYYTKYIDVDGDSSTFNSSTFTLNIPSGSKVVWAGLYWQGYIHNSDTNNDFRENMTLSGQTVSGSGKGLDLSVNSWDAEKVLFKTPQDTAYQTVTAQQVDFDFLGYAGFKDVTSLLSPLNANGIYTVANIQSHEAKESNHGNFAGWSLAVVYENSNEDLNNVSVFDGYATVDSSYNEDITVSGFYTPTSGTVESKVTVFSMEGESDTGDSLRLDGALLPVTGLNTDTGTQNNVFNGSITNVPVRTPIMTNNDGLDLDTFDTSSIITNGKSSATLRMRTTGDRYTPSMLVFSTQLYQPEVCYYEEVYKGDNKLENGEQVNKGDMLHVKVYVTNKADETAEKVKVYRTFDSLLPYIEDSTRLDNNNPTYGGTYSMIAQTDNVDTDTFDYDTTDKKFQIRIGTGADSVSGGNLIKNHGAAFDYNITMDTENNTSITYEVAYTNTAINFDYIGQIGKCVDFNNTFWGYSATPVNSGSVDVVDGYSGSGGTYNSWITTKVSKQPNVTLHAVYLGNDSANPVPQSYPGNNQSASITLLYKLADMSNGATCETAPTVNLTTTIGGNTPVVAVIDPGETSQESNAFVMGYVPSGTTTLAKKDLRIKYKVVDFNSLIDSSGVTCAQKSSTGGVVEGIPACLVTNSPDTSQAGANYKTIFGETAFNSCYHANGNPCYASNGGIGAAPYDHEYGCYECSIGAMPYTCSRDNFAIRPKEFQSGMTNGQIFVAAQSEEIIFRGNDYLNDATMDYNESENTSFQVDVNISDSTKVCVQPTLNLSPDINFTDGTNVVGGVTPSYVFENVGDFNVTMHEISGSEFALVDADDTADLDRLITPLERQIKVIPDHFVMNGSLSNGSNGFTYLSNFEAYPAVADRNVSALLDLNITAQAFDNNVTSNYTSTCYAKDGNLTMTLPAALNIAPLSKMIWYDTAHDLNGSIVLGGTSYPLPFVAAQFDSADENGTASVNYRLNFDRNETIAINPFTMTVNSVDANDTDAVSGNIVLNTTVNYVYGRVIPRDVRVFGAGTPFVANAWYEVFNTPTIGTTSLPVSKNDAQWNTNVVHVDFSDGDGFVTQSQINGANSVNAVAIGANSISGVATYTYTGLPLGAYKEHIETFPWLWYGVNAQMYIDPAIGNNINNCITHPCFNINVVPAVGATGSAETGAEAVKANKASTTGGGTWNSTSDYAPAVR